MNLSLAYIKLTGGQDVVAYVDDTDDLDLLLMYPMQLVIHSYARNTGMFHMMKWIPVSNDHEFMIKKSTVMHMHYVTENELVEFFEDSVRKSKWDVPPHIQLEDVEEVKENEYEDIDQHDEFIEEMEAILMQKMRSASNNHIVYH